MKKVRSEATSCFLFHREMHMYREQDSNNANQAETQSIALFPESFS